MKILIVSQYYPPEHLHIPADVAHHLASMGHSVRVITGYPNYPSGTIFDGYSQKWRTRELDRDVEVWRVPLYIDHSNSAVRRMINYISFAFSVASARRIGRGADAIYVYATQMTPSLGPWIWRLLGGAPYVLHVQDLWPDSITGSSLVKGGRLPGIIDALLKPWLSSLYKNAAAVIGIAPTMTRTLVKRGAAADKSFVVYNWAPGGRLTDQGATTVVGERSKSDTTRIVYAGNVGDLQDLETAVQAAHQASNHNISLTIVGDGVALNRVREVARQLDTTNVAFLGRVATENMAAIYATADFALVTLKDLPNFRGTIPSKFQASLAYGLPVITTVQGDLRAIVEETGLGLTADAEDVLSLADAFRRAAQLEPGTVREMSERAVEAHRSQFGRGVALSTIEGILAESVGSADK